MTKGERATHTAEEAQLEKQKADRRRLEEDRAVLAVEEAHLDARIAVLTDSISKLEKRRADHQYPRRRVVGL